ncbi:hypothetical protein HPB52_018067 [Rhipicephalus sanguineus]|uniref:Uncharacterized protein n=1 Tax=Rhipicephalus sanguineus TaxID=34632 RepID=A0A9D4Q1T4_RHISA|nr:hypothetical protein HPB52_018067 [Rhipicephalus sanguineus]
MDQAAFTVVSYKKKRAAGVPVIFKPTQPNRSFWKVNPNLLASAVVTTAQEKVLSHRLNKDGSLMVTMSSVPAANRLLAVTDLAGIAVEARVPYSYSATYGRIQDVPVEYSDDDLKEYLSEQGPRCANCGADHAASYGGCPKKKAATLARTMEQFQEKRENDENRRRIRM